MIDTVTDLTSLNEDVHHQLWQSQLLDEMGIGRWALQASPVIQVEAQVWQQFLDTSNPITTIQVAPSSIIQPTHYEQVLAPNDQHLQTLSLDHEINAPITEKSVQSVEQDKHTATPQAVEVIAQRFAIQAIVFNQWVLLVDETVLQHDAHQLRLWQQLQNQLKVSATNFRFPLLDEHQNFPQSSFALMQNAQIAWAGFAGFLHRLTQSHNLHNYQLGALSKLSACLDSQPIERLPYLTDMLQDYRQKRRLWQILNQS